MTITPEMMSKEKICGNCRFFKKQQCRRRSPVIIERRIVILQQLGMITETTIDDRWFDAVNDDKFKSRSHHDGRWPRVLRRDSCGEWESIWE